MRVDHWRAALRRARGLGDDLRADLFAQTGLASTSGCLGEAPDAAEAKPLLPLRNHPGGGGGAAATPTCAAVSSWLRPSAGRESCPGAPRRPPRAGGGRGRVVGWGPGFGFRDEESVVFPLIPPIAARSLLSTSSHFPLLLKRELLKNFPSLLTPVILFHFKKKEGEPPPPPLPPPVPPVFLPPPPPPGVGPPAKIWLSPAPSARGGVVGGVAGCWCLCFGLLRGLYGCLFFLHSLGVLVSFFSYFFLL